MRKVVMVFIVFWMLCTVSQELSLPLIPCSDASAEEAPGLRRTLRDPFVPPQMESIPVETGETADKKADLSKKKEAVKKPVKVKTVPAPPFSLTGIITGGSGACAIVFHPEKKSSYIITAGGTVGEYQITSITTEKIVVKRQSRSFQLELHKG
ncbi:MAG: hypothetical protein AB2L14_21295 [Candidatus Xenobiia bacterium LiM19]